MTERILQVGNLGFESLFLLLNNDDVLLDILNLLVIHRDVWFIDSTLEGSCWSALAEALPTDLVKLLLLVFDFISFMSILLSDAC